MPSSYPENIPQVIKILQEYSPERILDIGPGRGKYGLMAKEYLGEDTLVNAIEVFPQYIDERLRSIYDTVFQENALDYREEDYYDLVMVIDVIEHWAMDDAYELIDHLLESGCNVLVVTPRADLPQGAVNGNEWEKHISDWHTGHIEGRYNFKEYSNDISFMWYITP